MGSSRQHQADQRLHEAAERRDVAAAQRALDDGADPNSGLAPDSVLMSALDGGYTFLDSPERTALIELLLSRGADPDGQMPRLGAEVPIHTAAGFGMIEAVQALHRGGADLNRLDSDEHTTALGAAVGYHSFRDIWLGDDFFGAVLPQQLEELPIRFRRPGSDDINARVVHWLWGIQQVIPYLRTHGGLMAWELRPSTSRLVDAVCFTPDSPRRYYRPGRFQAGRGDHPLAREAFEAVPCAILDEYQAWCSEFVDPWAFGFNSARVLAFDYDGHATRGLHLLTQFMERLAMPELRASVSLHASSAIAAGCHLREQFEWSWPRRSFTRRLSWRDVPYFSPLDVQ